MAPADAPRSTPRAIFSTPVGADRAYRVRCPRERLHWYLRLILPEAAGRMTYCLKSAPEVLLISEADGAAIDPQCRSDAGAATRRLSATASAHLDLARGLAAGAVAFQHLRALLVLDWPQTTEHSSFAAIFYFFGKFGHPAVIVFFVLSGFLVGSSGLRSIESRHGLFAAICSIGFCVWKSFCCPPCYSGCYWTHRDTSIQRLCAL